MTQQGWSSTYKRVHKKLMGGRGLGVLSTLQTMASVVAIV